MVEKATVLDSLGGSPSSSGLLVSVLAQSESTSITNRSTFSTTISSAQSLTKISTPSTSITGLPRSSSAVSGTFTPVSRNRPARSTASISNNEFEMTTTFDKNLFVQNGQLYIQPTLTSDEIGKDAIFNGGNYTLSVRISPRHPFRHYRTPHDTISRGVQTQQHPHVPSVLIPARKSSYPPSRVPGLAPKTHTTSATVGWKSRRSFRKGAHPCSGSHLHVVSDASTSSDWLWPAIWMLPVNSVYGAWPASGEIDVSPLFLRSTPQQTSLLFLMMRVIRRISLVRSC